MSQPTGNPQVPYTRSTGNNAAEDVERKIKELTEDFRSLPDIEKRSSDEQSKARRIVQQINELDTELTAVLAQERIENSRLAATAGAPGMGGAGWKSGAERLFDTPQVQDWMKDGLNGTFAVRLDHCSVNDFVPGAGMERRAVMAVGEWGGAGPWTAGYPSYTGYPNYDPSGAGNLLPVGQPIPPVPRQAKLYLRDLIPVMKTSLPVVPYVQELTPTVTETASGAQTVAEGGSKPTANMLFNGAKADPTVIAATLTISKQLFEDAPLVVQYINNRLPYLIKFKEDQEFLTGSGAWPDILGIANYPDNTTTGPAGKLTMSGVPSQGSADLAQTVGSGYAQIENQDGMPTAVVLNPTDAWHMFTRRAAGGAGTFDAGTPFSALPMTIWGVPSYRTRVFAQGTVLVADFERGAAVVDREQVNVQTYRERYAELNEILLIAEERVGLAVFRPDLFTLASGLTLA